VYAFSVEGSDATQVLRPPESELLGIKGIGFVVAIDGDTAAIAPDGIASDEHGVAFIFRRSRGAWTYFRKVTTGNPEGVQFAQIGLAVDEPNVVATSPLEPGSTYSFDVPREGTD
jgi:hypothetical protein